MCHCHRGLSAKEIVMQRDGYTGEHLNFSDNLLAASQHKHRIDNHGASAQSQAKLSRQATKYKVQVGDLVFVKADGDKHTARDKYIVTCTNKSWLYARKLIGSQYRSKDYQLLYSEIFPVPTAVVSRKPSQGYQFDSDSDSDTSTDGDQHPLQHPESSDDSDVSFENIEHDSPGEEEQREDHDVNHNAPIPDPPAEEQVVEEIPNLRPPPVPPDLPHNESGGSESDIPRDSDSDQNQDILNPGRPQRRTRPPPALKDYVLHTPSDSDDD